MRPEDRVGQLLDGRLELTGILGVGAYGVVYTAMDIYTCTPYAIKALNKLGLDDRQRRFQAREIALHARAQGHPNIVSLVEILDAPDTVFVVMEFCPEGDLFTTITEAGHYVGDDALAKRVFLQLLDAVQYCHALGIYHRDLKPENILVCDAGYTVKLADFGLATTETYTSDFGCGSTFYMSPECHQPQNKLNPCYASAPNDVWSLGVILVNLTCGRNPWKRASAVNDETYRAYLRDPAFLQSILPLTPEVDLLLRRVFDPNPDSRISLASLRLAVSAIHRFTVSLPVAEAEDTSTFSSPVMPQTPFTHRQRPMTPPNSGGDPSFRNLRHEEPFFSLQNPPPTPVSPNQRYAGFEDGRKGDRRQDMEFGRLTDRHPPPPYRVPVY